MMLARLLRRPLVAGASQRTRTGLADFFEAGRDPNKEEEIVYGSLSENSNTRCALLWIKMCAHMWLASLFVKLPRVPLLNKSLVVKGVVDYWLTESWEHFLLHFTIVFETAAYHTYHHPQDFHGMDWITYRGIDTYDIPSIPFYDIILSGNTTCPNTSFSGLSCDQRDRILSCVAGRSWKAIELRQKSWEDLHQLWYVLLKEKNMLLSQKQMLTSQNLRMPNPERFPKVSLPHIFLHPLSPPDTVVWRSLV